MFRLGLWQPIFPELHLQYNFDQQNPHHSHKLHDHSVMTMAGVLREFGSYESWRTRAWAALLHDVGKPFVKRLHTSGTRYNYIDHNTLGAEIARRWLTDYRFSNADVKFIRDAVRDHLQDDHWLRPHDKAAKGVEHEQVAGEVLHA
jgi:tRNA nucleotidyltransferase (CCA-adding enzyme)